MWNKRILIVGLGLLGGSYARALTQIGCTVEAIDTNVDSIEYALENSFIVAGAQNPTAEMLARAQIVVLALYPKAEVEWLRQYQSHFTAGTYITDVSGVKQGVVDEIQQFLRTDLEFVGCHPMAGKEVSGVRNSTAEMFKPANFIVTPTEKNTEKAVQTVMEMAKLMGFRSVCTLSIDEHDAMIGFVSQLTHAIAVSLMTCNDDEDLQRYTGDSFRDLTRIARINEDMWSELFLMNQKMLLTQIDAFVAQMQRLRETIATGNADEMKEIFRKSTVRRTMFDCKSP